LVVGFQEEGSLEGERHGMEGRGGVFGNGLRKRMGRGGI